MNQNLNLKQQLRCIYISDFFSGLRITDAVWVALLAARGFSLWEIGLAESVYHIVSLFCEVPSGMAADLLGRRKTLLSGGVLTVTCNLLMAFAPNLFTICLAMGLNALAMTMFSGTFTALVYDSLKTEGREDEYIQVSANSSQISMLRTAFNLISYGTEGDSIAGVQYLTCVLASLNYLTAVPAQEEINEQLNSDIGHALKYIEQNIENPITLQELAQASNYSLSRFKAKFKEELGITPAEYITLQKMDRAQMLLKTTDDSITDIAYQLGFSSSNYFCSVFKKTLSYSPAAYRKSFSQS